MSSVSRERIGETALLAALFLLPWQTRWIFGTPTLHGGPWEYGVMSIYVVEVLIWIAAFALWRGRLDPRGPVLIFPLLLVISALVGVNSSVSLAFLIHIASAELLVLTMAAPRTCQGRTSASLTSTESSGLGIAHDRKPRGNACDMPFQVLGAAFLAGLVIPALFGWAQVLTGTQFASTELGLAAHSAADLGVAVVETPVGRLLRAYGPFSHPNVFGGYLVVGLLLCIWIDVQLKSRARLANAVLAAFLAATLVITFSRSAFLALILGLGCFFWTHRSHVRQNRALVGLLTGLLIAGIWFHVPLLSRVDASSRLEGKSVQERVGQYGEFLHVLGRAPWFGTGASGYTAALADAFPNRASWELQPVHNTFLLFLAEQGILGVLALILLLKQKGRRLLPLAILLPIALLDHYPWSSWAGLALVAGVWSFSVRIYDPEKRS